MVWPVYEAKARFSEMLDSAIENGPQIVSKRGVEAAVLVPIDQWRSLNERALKTMPDPLTDPLAPHDIPLPPTRPGLSLRPVNFDDEEEQG